MVFKNLTIICDNSGFVSKTRVIIDDIDFSDNLTEIGFSHKASDSPTLFLEIKLKGSRAE